MACQQLDVSRPVAQGRQRQREHIEPIKQVAPEVAASNHRLQVLVAGRDDAQVGLSCPRAADAAILEAFQEAQQGDLPLCAQRLDLVQEQRAAGSLFNQARPGGLGVRERASLMAEELALDQRFGQGAAVHRLEWSVAP